jgi:hypothetical protein
MMSLWHRSFLLLVSEVIAVYQSKGSPTIEQNTCTAVLKNVNMTSSMMIALFSWVEVGRATRKEVTGSVRALGTLAQKLASL